MRSLLTALRTHPDEVGVAAVNQWTRGSRRAGTGKAASIEIEVEDELVVNLRGDAERRDLLVLVRIPRAVVERLQRVIIPG